MERLKPIFPKSHGSFGQVLIPRMKTARASVQGADAGQPPAGQSKMAQATWWACAGFTEPTRLDNVMAEAAAVRTL